MIIRERNVAVGIFSVGLALFLLCAAINAQKQPPARPIDLNVANVKELQQLPGVGPVMAQRIIDAREKSGRFRRVEDLLAVRGISTKRLETIRPYIAVSAPTSAPPAQKNSPPAKKATAK